MTKVEKILAKESRSGGRRGIAVRKRRRSSHYYAFHSYSHSDEALANWIFRQLEQFRVPASLAGTITDNGVVPKRLTPIFRDQQELAAANDLGAEIRAALASSQFLIVLCTPAAAKSHWVNAEIDAFKRSRPDGCVLAVIGAGEPFASEVDGRSDEECFPAALRLKYDKQGRPTARKAEPLAADMRDDPEKRRTGFLKLVAGMLGVGLDDLVQRDTIRRQKRLAWVAAASLAGMAMTSLLAVTAIQARDSARDQRREAEGLVAFMLGDLKDKLEPIGKLDALDGVGTKVLDYYSKQGTSDLSEAGLLQRSRALSLSAQVAFLRGNLDAAQKFYREAFDGTAEALARAPDDPQRLFDHAQNVFWIGELERRLGRIGEAEKSFREYRSLADRMVGIEPDNLKWRMEVQYARENLGIVLMAQRRFAEAGQEFSNIIGPMQSLATIDPKNREYQRELTNALAWLADARWAEGRLDDAISIRQRQLSVLERIIGQGSADVGLRSQVTPARQALGLLLASRGRKDEAIAEYRSGLAKAGELVALEPENSQWAAQAAGIRLELAKALLGAGERQEAAVEVSVGCQSVAALRARNSGLAYWRRLQTNCLALRTQLALMTANLSAAADLAAQALAAARSEDSGDAAGDRYRIATAYRLLGDVRRRSGDLAGAREAWTTGLGQLPRNVAEQPSEIDKRAELLSRAGRQDEARPLVQRLAQ
ncbi:MAG: TIR domain-containing protein, partial [Pseudomonadota bacterium]